MSSQQRPNMRETIYRTHLEEYAERWQDENLAAGTPLGTGTVGGGCGAELDRFLAPGDVVELEIAGIGVAPERGRGGSGEHVAAAVAGGGGGGLRGATDRPSGTQRLQNPKTWRRGSQASMFRAPFDRCASSAPARGEQVLWADICSAPLTPSSFYYWRTQEKARTNVGRCYSV